MPSASPPDSIGQYTLMRKLGEGGMGVVHLAHHPLLQREVALKTLKMDGQTLPEQKQEMSERFLREARAVAQLNHGNVVAVLDAGLDGDTLFLVMEYVEGLTLSQTIQREGALPLARALPLFRQVCSGLEAAHRAGLIHRDIKPANILVSKNGQAKVMDFGLVQTAGSELTVSHQFLGTPNYMAPEQIESSRHVDARADIYALGATFYEALTGAKPFSAETTPALLYKILNDAPAPPSRLISSIPAGMDLILNKCLAKNPDNRFASVSDLEQELAGLMEGRPSLTLIDATPAAGLGGYPATQRLIEHHHRQLIQSPLLDNQIGFALNLFTLGLSNFPILHRLIRQESAFLTRVIRQLGTLPGDPLPPEMSASEPQDLHTGIYLFGFLAFFFGMAGLVVEIGYLGSQLVSSSQERIWTQIFALSTTLMLIGLVTHLLWSWDHFRTMDTLKMALSEHWGERWPLCFRVGDDEMRESNRTHFRRLFVVLIILVGNVVFLNRGFAFVMNAANWRSDDGATFTLFVVLLAAYLAMSTLLVVNHTLHNMREWALSREEHRQRKWRVRLAFNGLIYCNLAAWMLFLAVLHQDLAQRLFS